MSTTNTALPYTQRVEQIDAVAVAGQNGFFLPWGVYVRGEDILSVQVNGVVLVPGLPAPGPANDYVPMLRQEKTIYISPDHGWKQPTTADVVSGVWITTTMDGGEAVRITFVVRELLLTPPVPFPVYAPGGLLPASDFWFSYTPIVHPQVKVPNQLLVTGLKGLQVEFWQKSKRAGRVRVGPVTQIRTGKHWSPWWRTPVAAADGTVIIDPTAVPVLPAQPIFKPSVNRRGSFRLAYFDPASGARTKLSYLTLMVAGYPDKIGTVGTGGGIFHPPFSVWVGK